MREIPDVDLFSLSTNDLAKELINQQVIDISDRFPAKDGDSFEALMMKLFRSGTQRIPIIGLQSGEIFMLVGAKIQEHRTLAERLGVSEEDISFTTSLEGYPSDERNDRYLNMSIQTSDGSLYQPMLPVSDWFSDKPLDADGKAAINRVFSQIGSL